MRKHRPAGVGQHTGHRSEVSLAQKQAGREEKACDEESAGEKPRI